jgi:hypothetical protein
LRRDGAPTNLIAPHNLEAAVVIYRGICDGRHTLLACSDDLSRGVIRRRQEYCETGQSKSVRTLHSSPERLCVDGEWRRNYPPVCFEDARPSLWFPIPRRLSSLWVGPNPKPSQRHGFSIGCLEQRPSSGGMLGPQNCICLAVPRLD